MNLSPTVDDHDSTSPKDTRLQCLHNYTTYSTYNTNVAVETPAQG